MLKIIHNSDNPVDDSSVEVSSTDWRLLDWRSINKNRLFIKSLFLRETETRELCPNAIGHVGLPFSPSSVLHHKSSN